MARLEDIPQPTRDNIVACECPPLETAPWVEGPALSQRRIAILSTAGLFERGTAPFTPGSGGYTVLPASLAPNDILMSHVSINFDRSGWQRDMNVVYPLDRLRELADDGFIAGVADEHYSVLGSTDPKMMAETADSIVARMMRDRIDAILMSPV